MAEATLLFLILRASILITIGLEEVSNSIRWDFGPRVCGVKYMPSRGISQLRLGGDKSSQPPLEKLGVVSMRLLYPPSHDQDR
jgi:hypothetical protein